MFGGTSNTLDFLPLDRAGNRRFLPVMVYPEEAEVHILEASIEKLSSSRRPGGAEVNLAKKYPEVTLTNITTTLDLEPTDTYNIKAHHF